MKSVWVFFGFMGTFFFVLLLLTVFTFNSSFSDGVDASICLPPSTSMLEMYWANNPFNSRFIQYFMDSWRDFAGNFNRDFLRENDGNVALSFMFSFVSWITLLPRFLGASLALLLVPIEAFAWVAQMINALRVETQTCYVMGGSNNSDYASWSEWISGQQDSSLIGKVLLPPFNPLQGV